MSSLQPPDPVYVMYEEQPIHSLLFLDPNEDRSLLAGTGDGKVQEWDLRTYRKGRTCLETGSSPCIGLKYFNEMIVTQDKLGLIKVWKQDEESWSAVHSIMIDYSGFSKVDVGNDFGGIMVCPSKGGSVDIYNSNDYSRTMSFQIDAEKIVGELMAIKLIHMGDKPFVLAAYESGYLCLFDFETKKEISSLKFENCNIVSVDYDEKNTRGICVCVDENVYCFKIDEQTQLVSYKNLKLTNPGADIVRIRPDKKIVTLGCWDGRIRVFSWKSLCPLAVLMAHKGSVCDITFSKRYLTSGGMDGKITLWDIYNKE